MDSIANRRHKTVILDDCLLTLLIIKFGKPNPLSLLRLWGEQKVKKMKSKLCLILLVSYFGASYSAGVVAAEEEKAKTTTKEPATKKLYRYVDKNGKVYYSDQPRKGAKEMEVETIPSIEIKTPKVDLEELVEQTTKSKDKRRAFYDSIGFVNFPQESVIRNNSGSVAFSVALDPNLSSSHRIQFMLDGKNLGEMQTELSISANEINYGPHTISFNVVSLGGTVIQKSDVINFALLHTPRKKTGALNSSNNPLLNAKALQFPNAPKLPQFDNNKLPELPKVPTIKPKKETDT